MLILLLVLLVIGGFVVMTYNRLIAMIEAVRNNEKQIDVQLDRRYKVFESLIEVVKKYMDYEKSTLKQVVQLRQDAQLAKSRSDHETRRVAEDKISAVMGGLNVVMEQYPDLKASENAKQLQEEIVNTENKLSFAKQAFNDSIERYYALRRSFFTSMIVGCFANLNVDFVYWQLTAEKVKQQEDYTVKL
jgi:LemA protein